MVRRTVQSIGKNWRVFPIFTDALIDSSKAIESDETNVKAYLRKGIALYSQGKKEEARQTLKRGLEIDGQYHEMSNLLF